MECLGLSVESSGELLVEGWGMGWRRVWISKRGVADSKGESILCTWRRVRISKRGVADFYELCVEL